MIILGIDPGTAITGFAFIEKQKEKLTLMQCGAIITNKEDTDEQRLLTIRKDLLELIQKYKPEKAGIEKLYFETNQKTAITVAQARGVTLMTLAEFIKEIYEFTPLQVKNITCGYGKAQKPQMQQAVKRLFNLTSIPKPDDAADALAIAFCTAHSKKLTI